MSVALTLVSWKKREVHLFSLRHVSRDKGSCCLLLQMEVTHERSKDDNYLWFWESLGINIVRTPDSGAVNLQRLNLRTNCLRLQTPDKLAQRQCYRPKYGADNTLSLKNISRKTTSCCLKFQKKRQR